MADTAPGNPDWTRVAKRLEELGAVLPKAAELPPARPEHATELVLALAEATESLRRDSIRDRIQLSSFHEMMEALLRGRDSETVLQTLVLYLRIAFDLDEVLCLRRGVERWSGFHAGGSTWAVPVMLDDFPGGGASGSLADLERYSVVEMLFAPGASPADPEACLGCLSVRRDAGWSEARMSFEEISRRVANILDTLRHRESHERADLFRRQLLEAMRDGLLSFDAHGRVLEANEGAVRMLGLDRDVLLDQGLESLRAASPRLLEHLEDALSRMEALPPAEFPLGTAKRIPVNVATSPLWNDTGEFRGLVVNLTDLSGVRAMEEEIRRLDQLAALGRFAAGIAHEIRNPLAGIEAGVEYLGRHFPAAGPEREDLLFVINEVRRLNSIVSDLLDYTRPRPLEPLRVDAAALAHRARQSVEPIAQRRSVRVELSGARQVYFEADPDRIGQVLLNLVKNGVEAAPEGSEVQLSWRETQTTVEFQIEDRGAGLADEAQTRLFEPFFTTKGSGTGLGLSLSHAIVQQHGGHLVLENRSGGGAVARLELPLVGSERSERHVIVHPNR